MISFDLKIRDFPFNENSQAAIESWQVGSRKYGANWPVVYFIHNDETQEAYIGETLNAGIRAAQHWQNSPDRQRLKAIHIMTDDTFNKSVILNLESFLIKYISADGHYKLQNGNCGLANFDYYSKDEYEHQFLKVWEKLHELGLVFSGINDLTNDDLFKYSPYKTLNSDQQEVLNKIIFYLYGYLKLGIEHTIMVSGSAGTGKTILAIFLIKLLTDLANNTFEIDDSTEETDIGAIRSLLTPGKPLKIGFVVPMQSLRKTLKKVFNGIQGLSDDMILHPQDIAKKAADRPFDLLVCDEAHRLRRRWAINGFDMKRFDDTNELLGLPADANELDWIMKCSRMQLLFYDPEQTIKPTDIPRTRFEQIINQKSRISLNLKSQLRCLGGNDYIDYVKNILNGSQAEIISGFEKYEIRFFDDVDEMVDAINQRDQECGLSCTLAGYAWEWKTQKTKKNPQPDYSIPDIDIGRGYIWNRTDTDWINSSRWTNEVGCIHTSQGYDLNYVGVIFGPEITYNAELQRVDIIRDNYKDEKGKYVQGDNEALRDFILNIYATLMSRGIRGTYIYVCDPKLREYLRPYFS